MTKEQFQSVLLECRITVGEAPGPVKDYKSKLWNYEVEKFYFKATPRYGKPNFIDSIPSGSGLRLWK